MQKNKYKYLNNYPIKKMGQFMTNRRVKYKMKMIITITLKCVRNTKIILLANFFKLMRLIPKIIKIRHMLPKKVDKVKTKQRSITRKMK